MSNKNQLKEYYDSFVLCASNILYTIKRNVNSPTKTVGSTSVKLLDMLESNTTDLQFIADLINKTYGILSNNIDKLREHNTSLFAIREIHGGKKKKITLLRGIDIEEALPYLDTNAMVFVWANLEGMMMAAYNLYNMINPGALNNNVRTYIHNTQVDYVELRKAYAVFNPKSALANAPVFNPFMGVSRGDKSLSIDELTRGAEKIAANSKQTGGVDLMSIASGLSGGDLSGLKKQLKNIDKKTMDDVKKNIKTIFSSQGNSKIDPAFTAMMETMIDNITHELKNTDLDKGNVLDSMMAIANNVSNNMASDIEKNKDTVETVLKSAVELAKNTKTPTGENLFNGNDPMKMLTSMLEQHVTGNNTDNTTNMSDNNVNDMAQNMLDQLGIKVDMNNLQNMDLSNLDLTSFTNNK